MSGSQHYRFFRDLFIIPEDFSRISPICSCEMPTDAPASPGPGGKEKNAIDFFREYGEDIQQVLRNPDSLADREEWGSFETLIFHLDRALEASGFSSEVLLFRGIHHEYARNFLFMLDADEKTGEEGSGQSLVPYLIRDPGYNLFTTNPSEVLRELPAVTGEPRVMVAYLSRPGDHALPLDEKAGEVLYPRNTTWVTTGATSAGLDGTEVTIIAIEMAGRK